MIYGTGGHATSVTEAIRAGGGNVAGYIDDVSATLPEMDAPTYRQLPRDAFSSGTFLVLAVGDNFQRAQLWQRIQANLPQVRTRSVLHPTAVISATASVADGAVVLAGAIIGAQVTVGPFALVNTGAVVDHGCHLAEFSSVGPGAVLGGSVRVGARAVVGMGAIAREKTRIGSDAVLGAASYLHGDLEPESVGYGRPAQKVRTRAPQEPYMR